MEFNSAKAVTGIDYEMIYNIFYECSKIVEASWGLKMPIFHNKDYFNDFGQYFQPIQSDVEKALFFGELKEQDGSCPLHIECAINIVNYIVIENPVIAIPAMLNSLKYECRRIKPLYNDGHKLLSRRFDKINDYAKTIVNLGLVQ